MYQQLNGTLGQELQQYSYQQQCHKYAAVPIKDIKCKIGNSQKYSNPPYINIEQINSECQQQRQSFSLTIKKQNKITQTVIQQRRKEIMQINNNKTEHNRNKWGNFLVIYDNGSTSITLGPDYWCFIPAYICFLLAGIGIIILVMSSTTNIINRILSLLVCGTQLISYLLVAISNPGVAQNKYLQEQEYTIESFTNIKNQQPQKYCKICNFRVPKSSYHCRECDICIKGYDHHCPWTSKCIGQNNLSRFYFFLCMTPLFIIYVAVCFIIIMGEQTQSFNIHKIRQLFECQNYLLS